MRSLLSVSCLAELPSLPTWPRFKGNYCKILKLYEHSICSSKYFRLGKQHWTWTCLGEGLWWQLIQWKRCLGLSGSVARTPINAAMRSCAPDMGAYWPVFTNRRQYGSDHTRVQSVYDGSAWSLTKKFCLWFSIQLIPLYEEKGEERREKNKTKQNGGGGGGGRETERERESFVPARSVLLFSP